MKSYFGRDDRKETRKILSAPITNEPPTWLEVEVDIEDDTPIGGVFIHQHYAGDKENSVYINEDIIDDFINAIKEAKREIKK